MLISLKHDEDKSLLLLLHCDNQYDNVFMAPDRTKYQRRKHKKFVEELNEGVHKVKRLGDLQWCYNQSSNLGLLVSPLLMVEELLFSLPDDVHNKDEIKLTIANFCVVTYKQSEIVFFLYLLTWYIMWNWISFGWNYFKYWNIPQKF